MINYYASGLPFSEVWAEPNLLNFRKRVVEDNKASLIIVDGSLGSGKTTFAVHSSDFINGAYTFNKDKWVFNKNKIINFQKQLSLGGESFVKNLKVCFDEKLVVLIYDEGGDFTSRGAITKFNRLLNRVFDVYRAFKIVVFLVMPCVAAIDSSIFDKGIVRALVNCSRRNNSYSDFKVYSAKSIGFLLERMKKYGKNKKLAYSSIIPCIQGHFLDLPEKRADELRSYSTDNKLSVLIDVNLSLEGYYDYKELSSKLGRSISWTKKALSSLNLKPVKKHKNKSYFDEEVLSQLLQHLEEILSNDMRGKK